jgi:7-cyano-7-deazaguanine synthase
MPTMNAIVLLSGGLDSATTLAIAKSRGFDCHALSFRYGQRHGIEIAAASKIAKSMGAASHMICDIDLRQFGGSALTDNLQVPKHRSMDDMSHGIPITYVPARNTIFLSFALAAAETAKAFDIFIGVNALDYSGYPDCRPEFIEAFQNLALVATKACVEAHKGMKIHAPLMSLNKSQIIREGLKLGVDYSLTRSCYDPDGQGRACGQCDSCQLRLKGFSEAGFADPIEYYLPK